ncbi:hypothetical protein DPMN_026531 [Dreissena polymorpha]|uniref:Uncharacterized protein n=1 Tax=Dreissena polymorpha TaxID=45954 RepID=A0A9D4LT46_DREPO|nr:hypothetical protein DPMN_026531 [Dreissena polymorpha]
MGFHRPGIVASVDDLITNHITIEPTLHPQVIDTTVVYTLLKTTHSTQTCVEWLRGQPPFSTIVLGINVF